MQRIASEPRPLTETVFFLLLSLKSGPLHGYGMMKDIESLSDGRIRLTTGTLYGALKRLLQEEWIVPFEQEDSSRDKKAYRLTELGCLQLDTEINRLRQVMAAISTRTREASP